MTERESRIRDAYFKHLNVFKLPTDQEVVAHLMGSFKLAHPCPSPVHGNFSFKTQKLSSHNFCSLNQLLKYF